eukprot:SAG31_NODE_2543_length_5534_cov_9.026311_6_plen_97_part_00
MSSRDQRACIPATTDGRPAAASPLGGLRARHSGAPTAPLARYGMQSADRSSSQDRVAACGRRTAVHNFTTKFSTFKVHSTRGYPKNGEKQRNRATY